MHSKNPFSFLLFAFFVQFSCQTLSPAGQGILTDLCWSSTPNQVTLSWVSEGHPDLRGFRIEHSIKRIGFGRKPFTLLSEVGPEARTAVLDLPGLSDVFLRVTPIIEDGEGSWQDIRIQVSHARASHFSLDDQDVFVYLPEGYDPQRPEPYPVIYACDGQLLFSSGTAGPSGEWQVDEMLDRLISQGRIEPLVVVGVASKTSRRFDYWPRAFGPSEGRGEEFAQWMIERLLPWAEDQFHISQESYWRGIMGSSYGGVISLYLGAEYPEIFGTVLALSPAMDQGGQDYLAAASPLPARIYLDAGEKEYYQIIAPEPFDFPANARFLAKVFAEAGKVYGEDLVYFEDPGKADHKEPTVAARLAAPLVFFAGEFGEDNSELRAQLSFSHQPEDGRSPQYYINAIVQEASGFQMTLLDLGTYLGTKSQGSYIAEDGSIEGPLPEDPELVVRYLGREASVIVNP